MTRPELDMVLDWAAGEGWNPGVDDADAFWAADPHGFFIAEEGGTPVAAISVVNHSEGFAFLGLYICRPSHRGRGVGLGLWHHAMAHAGRRTVGLDGVVAQQANYARSGFLAAGATRRLTGRPPPASCDRVRPARPRDVPALVALEAAASGIAKPRYMAAWFTSAETRRTYLVEEGGRIVAAATIRQCRDGSKVGPLLARTAEEAWTLLSHVAATADGPVTVDIPDLAPELADRCLSEGMDQAFVTARMYRGAAPPAPAGGIVLYGIGSLELG